MLTLKLFHFRCWRELQLTFPANKITLLRGVSGGGKSTIFAAIAWCLFGNLRMVAPLTNEKAKTAVTLSAEIAGQVITIVRSKNPNRLQVSLRDLCSQGREEKHFEDKVAAAIIESLFGKYEIWLTSCYLAQNCRNSFLGVSNIAKLQLLEDIAFLQENPTVFIEKIESRLVEIERHYKGNCADLQSSIQEWEKEYGTVEIKYLLEESDLQTIRDQLQEEENKLTVLAASLVTYQVNKRLYDSVRQELVALQTLANELPPISIPVDGLDLQLIDHDLSIIWQAEEMEAALIRQRRQLELLEQESSTTENSFTEEAHQQARNQELAWQQQSSLARQLGVEYTTAAIAQRKQENSFLLDQQEERVKTAKLALVHRRFLHHQEKLPRLSDERDRMAEELRKLVSVPVMKPDYTAYNVEPLHQQVVAIQQEINRLTGVIDKIKDSANILTCPHCSQGLRYYQQKLIPVTSAPPDSTVLEQQQRNLQSSRRLMQQYTEEIARKKNAQTVETNRYHQEIHQQNLRIQSLHNMEFAFQELQRKLSKCQKKLEQEREELQGYTVEVKHEQPLTGEQVQRLQANLLQLENIQVVTLPAHSSDYIYRCLQRQSLREQFSVMLDKQNATLALVSPQHARFTYAQLVIRKQEVEVSLRRLQQAQEVADRIACIEKRCQQLEDLLTVDPQIQIDFIVANKSQLTVLLAEYTLMHRAQQQLALITTKRAELESVYAELSDYHLLRQKARDCECAILQQAVDSINSSVANICDDLFSSDILMKLQLFKEMKSTKEVKPTVNFTIAYREGLFDNINQLSGGEGDRASLALTLGLNSLSTCPFLLLDETLGSLDGELKTEAIHAISSNTNKTVILVMHDGVEGIFDSVINIDELK